MKGKEGARIIFQKVESSNIPYFLPAILDLAIL